jgi:F-type H+-transporting ATPase subunit b
MRNRTTLFTALAVVTAWLLPLLPAPAYGLAEEEAAPAGHSASAAAAAGGEGSHAAAAAAGHEKPDLLPSMTSSETWLSALWVIIIFLVLLAVLYPTAWKSVLAGLKAREDRIRRDIQEAEAARARAEASLKEYTARLATAEQQVRDMLNKATAQGETIAAGIRTRAQQESEETKDKALRDIEASRKQAIADVYEQAASLATEVAKRVLPRALTPEDQQALLDRSLEQVQTLRSNGGGGGGGSGDAAREGGAVRVF